MDELLEKQRALSLQQEKIFGKIKELTSLESSGMGNELLQSVEELLGKPSPANSPMSDKSQSKDTNSQPSSMPVTVGTTAKVTSTSESISFINETLNKISAMNNEQHAQMATRTAIWQSAEQQQTVASPSQNSDPNLGLKDLSLLSQSPPRPQHLSDTPHKVSTESSACREPTLGGLHVPSPTPRSPTVAKTSDRNPPVPPETPQIRITPGSGVIGSHSAHQPENAFNHLSTSNEANTTLTPRSANQISFVQVSTTYAPGESQRTHSHNEQVTDIGSAISYKGGSLSPRSIQNDISFQKVSTTDSFYTSPNRERSPQLSPRLVVDDISFQKVSTELSPTDGDRSPRNPPHLQNVEVRGRAGGSLSPQRVSRLSPRSVQNDISIQKVSTINTTNSSNVGNRSPSSRPSQSEGIMSIRFQKVETMDSPVVHRSPQTSPSQPREVSTGAATPLRNNYESPTPQSRERILHSVEHTPRRFSGPLSNSKTPENTLLRRSSGVSPISYGTTPTSSSSSISSSHSYKRPGSVPRIDLNSVGVGEVRQQSSESMMVTQPQDAYQHVARDIQLSLKAAKGAPKPVQGSREFSSSNTDTPQVPNRLSVDPSATVFNSQQFTQMPNQTSASPAASSQRSDGRNVGSAGDEILQLLSSIVGNTEFPSGMSLDAISGENQRRKDLVAELRNRKPDGVIDMTQVTTERQCQLLEQSNDLKNLQLQLVESVISGMDTSSTPETVTTESVMLDTPHNPDIRDRIVLGTSSKKKKVTKKSWDQSTLLSNRVEDKEKKRKELETFKVQFHRVPYRNGSHPSGPPQVSSPLPASPRPEWVNSTRLTPSQTASWNCSCQNGPRKTQIQVASSTLKRELDGIIKKHKKQNLTK
eukprot:TRINITY_DN1601_c1_g2_i1.p1 TRINITY_DN1601_c1_g2~~TRINITY_DN1601_c1_g2_i1.p1  ORF type:complete len:872 (+),score=162.30 TRINITY_DN1601_c1_g2_i1:483-3098(+)